MREKIVVEFLNFSRGDPHKWPLEEVKLGDEVGLLFILITTDYDNLIVYRRKC